MHITGLTQGGSKPIGDAVSQMNHDPFESETTAEAAALIESARPPRSKAAVVAFVVALVLVLPLTPVMAVAWGGMKALLPATIGAAAAALAAAILGVVAIFRCRGRRRRGRGLAIAAIPIGLAAAFLELVVGVGIHQLSVSTAISRKAVLVLKSPSSALTKNAADWYDKLASKRFKATVKPEEFEAWVASIIDERGQLQNFKPAQGAGVHREGSAAVFKFIGQFVNGGAPIEVHVGMDDGRAKIDDIRVGGSSPLR